MIIGLSLYILFGFIVFMLCRSAEEIAEYDDPEWFKKFYNKSRSYRISVRLTQFIFWPIVIIGLILYVLNIGAKYFYENLIK